MAEAPTDESSARRIVQIFRDHSLKAGDVLQSDSFVAPFSKPGWSSADLDAGLDHAVAEDWLEQVSQTAYRLTRDGFNQG